VGAALSLRIGQHKAQGLELPYRRKTIPSAAHERETRSLCAEREKPMETLHDKRARLRHELQQAYRDWILVCEAEGCPITTPARADILGRSGVTKAKWIAYLAAKERLGAAYAERAAAPSGSRS
jgi:hypothetical protein